MPAPPLQATKRKVAITLPGCKPPERPGSLSLICSRLNAGVGAVRIQGLQLQDPGGEREAGSGAKALVADLLAERVPPGRDERIGDGQIGRAHVWTPVTDQ